VHDLSSLLRTVHDQYRLPWFGLHGVSHWARVYENGLRLAPLTGADEQLLLLFAIFHDARRVNEGWDDGHGRRGAELASSLRATALHLPPPQFDLLYHACALHTDGLVDGDPTVQTCWDADRLDLPRAGIEPSPQRLCTEPARREETIAWATERSVRRVVPPIVAGEWAVAGEAVPPEADR
jgi:uncharacterized protein